MTTLTSTDTRERLLLAGMHVFAAGGFESGTIREITSRAGANQAAVNYHFGNKAALYEAVVQRAFEHALVPLDAPAAANRDRVELVRALVSDIVSGALRELTPATHLRIITAEILRPTGALQSLASNGLANRAPQLAHKIESVASDAAGDGTSLLLAHWLLGSCLVALQLAPRSAYGNSEDAQREQGLLVEQLTGLLLNGMNGLGLT